MSKKQPKRSKDINQIAKSIVDIATGKIDKKPVKKAKKGLIVNHSKK